LILEFWGGFGQFGFGASPPFKGKVRFFGFSEEGLGLGGLAEKGWENRRAKRARRKQRGGGGRRRDIGTRLGKRRKLGREIETSGGAEAGLLQGGRPVLRGPSKAGCGTNAGSSFLGVGPMGRGLGTDPAAAGFKPGVLICSAWTARVSESRNCI